MNSFEELISGFEDNDRPLSNKKATFNPLHDILKALQDRGLDDVLIGKLYAKTAFKAPERCSLGKASFNTPQQKQRKKNFQEYHRIIFSYAFFHMEYKKFDVPMYVNNMELSTDEMWHPSDSIEKTLAAIFKEKGVNDDTLQLIGRAVIRGAEEYENLRLKQGGPIKKYKLLSEYSSIYNQLKNLLPKKNGNGNDTG